MLTPSTEVDEGRLRIEKCADDFGVNELNEWIVGCVGFYFVGLVRYRVGSRHAYGALVSSGSWHGPLSSACRTNKRAHPVDPTSADG